MSHAGTVGPCYRLSSSVPFPALRTAKGQEGRRGGVRENEKLAFRSERSRNLVSFKNAADFFVVRTVEPAINGIPDKSGCK